MQYRVKIKKTADGEEFGVTRTNVATIKTLCLERDISKTNSNCVILSLSKVAMIEFGKALICEAQKDNEYDITHFYPARPGAGLVVTYEIIIHPDSIEPIIGYEDLGTIDSYLKDSNKG